MGVGWAGWGSLVQDLLLLLTLALMQGYQFPILATYPKGPSTKYRVSSTIPTMAFGDVYHHGNSRL